MSEMSTVKEVIEDRRSVRKYRDDPVPDEILLQILEAARLAPSGSNTQPWRFVVVRNEDTKLKLKEAAVNQKFVGEAPVVIACCGDLTAWREYPKKIKELVSGRPDDEWNLSEVNSRMTMTVRNVAIACEHMVLQATELGLGTCWVGMMNREKVKEILCVPDHLVVVILLTIGYPDEEPRMRPRLDLSEIVFGEEYGKKLDM
ncbi:MAG: nitroreductase family protein [Halobacteriota archaeon]|nr:nitroreductase family protein [Halobacteriota archaeon]